MVSSGQENQGAEDKGDPAHPHDPLAPAHQQGKGTGATRLLDGDNEADGRRARLRPPPAPLLGHMHPHSTVHPSLSSAIFHT